LQLWQMPIQNMGHGALNNFLEFLIRHAQWTIPDPECLACFCRTK